MASKEAKTAQTLVQSRVLLTRECSLSASAYWPLKRSLNGLTPLFELWKIIQRALNKLSLFALTMRIITNELRIGDMFSGTNKATLMPSNWWCSARSPHCSDKGSVKAARWETEHDNIHEILCVDKLEKITYYQSIIITRIDIEPWIASHFTASFVQYSMGRYCISIWSCSSVHRLALRPQNGRSFYMQNVRKETIVKMFV